MSERMRAAQYAKYGRPAVLTVATIDRPVPGPGEVLVRVHGSSVNSLDTAIRRGRLRLATGFGFPKGSGVDFAGEVESIGAHPEPAAPALDGKPTPDPFGAPVPFGEGDRVWGFLPGLPHGPIGGASEFIVARAGTLSVAPSSVELRDAATLPLVGSAALLALREHGRLRAGHRLLVRGAAGGVGTAAIQLGASVGAHVTAMVSDKDLDFVRSVGAHDALDYRTHGAGQVGSYDVILDLVGTHLAAYRRHLSSHGRMITTASRGAGYVIATSIYGPRRVRPLLSGPKTSVLADLAELVDSGAIAPVIDSVVPLADIAMAHAAVEDGRSRGKYVVDVRA